MTVLYPEAPASLAGPLSVLMKGAWLVQHHAGNSGWTDTIRTLSLGLAPVLVGGIPPLEARMLRATAIATSVPDQSVLSAAAASMIPTRRARVSAT